MDQLSELDNGCLDTGSDVEGARIERTGRRKRSGCGEDVRVRDIGDAHVVAGLLSITEYGQCAPSKDAFAEDCDDARLPMGILRGP